MENLRSYLEIWAQELTQTIEMMTGSPANLKYEASSVQPDGFWFENTLSLESGLNIAVGASKSVWNAIGSAVLSAAGLEENDDESRKTWAEILQQTAGSTARRVGEVASAVVNSSEGKEISTPFAGEQFGVKVSLGSEDLPLVVVLSTGSSTGTQMQTRNSLQPAIAQSAPASGTSRTMEALLDVHMPVSLSFGQAKIPLRDVPKLTTGSVVELNKQPEDSVDIIVNDCVIARGEVVVVEGNYAVRIQSIIGRQQRMNLRPDRSDDRGISR